MGGPAAGESPSCHPCREPRVYGWTARGPFVQPLQHPSQPDFRGMGNRHLDPRATLEDVWIERASNPPIVLGNPPLMKHPAANVNPAPDGDSPVPFASPAPAPSQRRRKVGAAWLGCLLAAAFGAGSARAATYTVTGTADTAVTDGVCTLREAISAANGATVADCPAAPSAGATIAFDIPDPGPVGPGGSHTATIAPTTPLPALTAPVTIDGTTQPAHGGAAAACPAAGAASGAGSYGPLLVVIDGTSYPFGTAGLTIRGAGAGGSVIRGLVMNHFSAGLAAGVAIADASGNHVECNLFGTDAAGATVAANNLGLRINGGADNVVEGNLITASTNYGIDIEASHASSTARTVVRNNRFGTNAAGTAGLAAGATGYGVWVAGQTFGSTDGTIVDGNLITEGTAGVALNDTNHTRVRGNRIGTNAAGTAAFGNGTGVLIVANSVGASDNVVGTDSDGVNDGAEGNLISGNFGSGVSIFGLAPFAAANNRVSGNLIGVTAGGNAALGNQFGVSLDGLTGGNVVGTNGDGKNDAGERNVLSGNVVAGVYLSGDGDWVAGNYIGVGADGATALTNRTGVELNCSTGDTPVLGNLIGTNADGKSDELERNVISGNTNANASLLPGGVVFEGAGCSKETVAGNYIGLDAGGSIAVPNSYGVALRNGAHDNLIGTNGDGVGDEAERNVISGNVNDGVAITRFGADITNNRIAGNWIGLAATGGAVVPNGTGGVSIFNASGNVIGSDDATPNPAEGNVIAGHAPGYGVSIQGASATGNRIAGNAFGTNATHSAFFPNQRAILVTSSATASVAGNVLFASSLRGLELSSSANLLAASSNNCVVRNAAGALNSTGGLTPVFEANWWGVASGPNTPGGDTASGVDASNWLTTAPAGCPSTTVPAIGKSFLDSAILLNATTVLTVTMDNPSATAPATAVSFSDPLPSGLRLAGTPTTSGCGAGAVTGSSGDPEFSLSGATIAASSTCVVTAPVRGVAVGTQSNQITDLAATVGGSTTGGSSNVATVTVLGLLTISKTDGVTTASPGGTVTYTIVAANTTSTATPSATVTDVFPAALTCTWTCAGTNGATCTAAGSGSIDDPVSLPANGSVTYTAACTISAAATGMLANTATITTPDNSTTSATDTDTLAPQADLSIAKTDGVTNAVPGGAVTYTITAANAGPSDAPGATVTDSFPAVLACTWTCAGAGGGTCTAAGSGNLADTANLPAGGSATYTATCAIAAVAAGTLANTATVTVPAGVADPTPGNNSATDSDTLTAQADLSISKTDGVATATAGGAVTYTITVANTGPSNAPGAIVADTFPASLTCTWTCVGAGGGACTAAGSGNIANTVNLPAGGSVTFTAGCTVAAAATGTLANTATVTAPAGVTDGAPGNNSATDSDTLESQADLSITKTDGVTHATPGGSVTYTVTASNAGPSNASGATVADTFPASLTCTWTCAGAGGGTCTAAGSGNIADTVNLPVGGSVTFTAGCTVAAAATGTLANTATVTAPAGVTDGAPGNNSATDSDTLAPQADLAITKTDGVTHATPGGSVTYTVTASNAGPSDAPGATVADTFPASLACTWTCAGAGGGTCTAAGTGNIAGIVNLPAGASVTYTARCTVAAAATGTLSNTATVTAPAGVIDGTPGNNSATDTDTLAPQADLAITKTDGVAAAAPGGHVTYTITASNAGPSNAPAASVTDTFPARLTCTWTCTGVGGGACTAAGSGNIAGTVSLPVGASVTYTASCAVALTASGTLSNTATVAAGSGVTDPAPANNSATDSDTLAPQADLSITKTDGVATAVPGGSVTYTLVAANAGPSNAPGTTVTDTFPATLTCTWTCAGAGGGTCTAAGSGNLADAVNLPAGATITYTASCAVALTATGTLSNTATVAAGSGVTDPAPDNNSATDSDALGAQADLAITKTDGVTTATPGGSVTYTIVAANSGPSNAPGTIVTDTFPAALSCTWTCAGSGGATCAASGSGNLTSTANLPAGGAVTYTATCAVSPAATGMLANTATVATGADVVDPTPGNNSATDTDTLAPQADLGVTLTDGAAAAAPGGTLVYTLVASNHGPTDAPGATVTDTFPAALACTWTCSATAGGTCAASGSGNIDSTVNLPHGASATYTATCTLSSAATGTISDTAAIAAPAGVADPTPDNNSATDTDTLEPSADLRITKTAGSPTAQPAKTVTYQVVATNAGPSDAPGSKVTDTFPAGLTACTWTCTGSGGATCTASGAGNLGDTVDLPAGGTVTYAITCTVAGGATGTLSNTATVATGAGAADPAPGNNSSTAALPVMREIPTLGGAGLAFLGALLAALGLLRLRRRAAGA